MSEYTAVITGASKGIGAGLAKAMLAKGYRVISLARNKAGFTHEKFHDFELDLMDKEACINMADNLAEKFQVSHLILNAGIIRPNLIEDAQPEDILDLSQLHLASSLILLKAFLPAMKQHNFGRVLFNASRAVLGVPTRSAYSASKAGMIGMARTWALELAPFGVTVNVVAPGPIETDNFWEIIPKGSEREKALAERMPVRRLGTVEDVVNTFMFFCEPNSSFITGQTLYVCGGASIGSTSL